MVKKYKLNIKRVINVFFAFCLVYLACPSSLHDFRLPVAHAVSQTFTSSGQWQAPAGVTSVTVEAWGGGGAGGGRGSSSGVSGGGGGGAYAKATITVTPLQTYQYTVGAGGTGGTGNGGDGNFSQWENGLVVKAAGGRGGASSITKGLGGAIINSVGTIIYKGGDGADGGSTSGGGGGGAGSTGAGGNATAGGHGVGTSQGGGNGGDGVVNASGNIGSAAGGGGSGAHRTNGNRRGGDGATGQIRITYNTPPSFTVNPTDSPDPVTVGSNVTFTATSTDSEANNWYLVICKTNIVNAGIPPSCETNQTVCVSSSAVASGSQNSCTWATAQAGTQSWFAFACDNDTVNPICSTANTAGSPLTISPVISVTITSDGMVAYGTLNSGESRSTLELSDTQVALNDSNVTEDFNIKTSSPSGWSIGTSIGLDVFMHEYSSDGGNIWTKLTTADNYQSLKTNIVPSSSQSFDLRFTAPNPSSTGGEKTINITIQATES